MPNADTRQLVVELNNDSSCRKRGRKFYSEEAFRELPKEVDFTNGAEPGKIDADSSRPGIVRQVAREEDRLCKYIYKELESIYWGVWGPDAPYVFNVGANRPGKKYENIDLLAIDWKSETRVELVSVEAKLNFTAEAVAQAISYQRFSHRVWVACLLDASKESLGRDFREQDPALFEYLVSRGLGLLACRKGMGGSYSLTPIHWPSRGNPDPVELDLFVARYRACFVEARMVPDGPGNAFPAYL